LTRPSTIAIDGPAASGKSTIGGLLAERLGYVYFDTGVMYRAVTWAAIARGIGIEDEARVTALAQQLQIDVVRPTLDDGRQYTILADGQDVTWKIRKPEVDRGVSPVSAYAGVRAALSAQQRRIAQKGRIVMVGRDIGTVVLPEADLKIYLEATVEERAGRRYREVIGRGEPSSFEAVLASVLRRDQIDSNRSLAPLRAAEDAVVIDTTTLSVDQVMERVLALVNAWSERLPESRLTTSTEKRPGAA
jgi:cytidylate kinase